MYFFEPMPMIDFLLSFAIASVNDCFSLIPILIKIGTILNSISTFSDFESSLPTKSSGMQGINTRGAKRFPSIVNSLTETDF